MHLLMPCVIFECIYNVYLFRKLVRLSFLKMCSFHIISKISHGIINQQQIIKDFGANHTVNCEIFGGNLFSREVKRILSVWRCQMIIDANTIYLRNILKLYVRESYIFKIIGFSRFPQNFSDLQFTNFFVKSCNNKIIKLFGMYISLL